MRLFKRRDSAKKADDPTETPKDTPPVAPRPVHYLISPAGVPNYGDELISRSWLRHLAQVEPDSEVWLDCINPGVAAHLFNGAHPHLHITDTVWQLIWSADRKTESAEDALQLVDRWVRDLATPRLDLGILQLRCATSIHLLGGGYINSNWCLHSLIARIARDVKEMNPDAKLYGTGLGLTPWDDDCPLHELLRHSLEAFDHLGVRDSKSSELFSLPVDNDDALLVLNEGDGAWTNSDWPSRLFVCLQEDVVGRHEETVKQVVQALLASGAGEEEHLTLVESIPPDDNWSLPLFIEAWKGEVSLLPFIDLWNHGIPKPEDAIWATSRYHMHLLAAATGARGASIEFGNDYYGTKHGALRALGSGWGILQADSPIACTDDEDFPTIARNLAKKKQAEAKRLYPGLTQ